MLKQQQPFWQSDVSPAAWLRDALGPWCKNITSVVPGGFSRYARILHPAGGNEPPGGGRRSWAEVAHENARVPHSTMQFHNISRPRDSPSTRPGIMPSTGAMPVPERGLLVDLLATETTTPDRCWFCMWDGWGNLDDQGVTARVQLPNRRYLLYTGAIMAAVSVPPLAMDRVVVACMSPTGKEAPPPMTREAKKSALVESWRNGPALWWPNDRAWVVATEIDLAWTYVGGSEQLIRRLVAHSGLEAWRAQSSDPFTANSDALNAALDAPCS